jgi:hypothetical protein
MAGITKDIQVTEIHQGPGDLWVIPTAPVDATPRLTLASDGTPDSTAHPASVHLGAIQSAITTSLKPKIAAIDLDQLDAAIDGYVTDFEAKIEAEMAQTRAAKLQRALGVATFASGAGYEQLTFGGNLTVPTLCLAAISPKRISPKQYIVSMLFKAAAVGGFSITFGRSKASTYKCGFLGLTDPSRTAGKQIGTVYETLQDAAGGTVQAKDFTVGEIYQGPADLWLISPAPADATQKVTLDATTLTPDAAVHANSKHLGGTAGSITLTVTPKIGNLRLDQFDGPVDVFVESLEAKLEAEMSQSEMQKLARALSVGTYSTDNATYKQLVYGGSNQPESICVAAIAQKRLAGTKAIVACLYNVNSTGGVDISMSRKKASTYKVTFTGLVDPARTAGRQIGIYHEMV